MRGMVNLLEKNGEVGFNHMTVTVGDRFGSSALD